MKRRPSAPPRKHREGCTVCLEPAGATPRPSPPTSVRREAGAAPAQAARPAGAGWGFADSFPQYRGPLGRGRPGAEPPPLPFMGLFDDSRHQKVPKRREPEGLGHCCILDRPRPTARPPCPIHGDRTDVGRPPLRPEHQQWYGPASLGWPQFRRSAASMEGLLRLDSLYDHEVPGIPRSLPYSSDTHFVYTQPRIHPALMDPAAGAAYAHRFANFAPQLPSPSVVTAVHLPNGNTVVWEGDLSLVSLDFQPRQRFTTQSGNVHLTRILPAPSPPLHPEVQLVGISYTNARATLPPTVWTVFHLPDGRAIPRTGSHTLASSGLLPLLPPPRTVGYLERPRFREAVRLPLPPQHLSPAGDSGDSAGGEAEPVVSGEPATPPPEPPPGGDPVKQIPLESAQDLQFHRRCSSTPPLSGAASHPSWVSARSSPPATPVAADVKRQLEVHVLTPSTGLLDLDGYEELREEVMQLLGAELYHQRTFRTPDLHAAIPVTSFLKGTTSSALLKTPTRISSPAGNFPRWDWMATVQAKSPAALQVPQPTVMQQTKIPQQADVTPPHPPSSLLYTPPLTPPPAPRSTASQTVSPPVAVPLWSTAADGSPSYDPLRMKQYLTQVNDRLSSTKEQLAEQKASAGGGIIRDWTETFWLDSRI